VHAILPGWDPAAFSSPQADCAADDCGRRYGAAKAPRPARGWTPERRGCPDLTRDLVDRYGEALSLAGFPVPDPRPYRGEAFLMPFEKFVEEVAGRLSK